MGPGGEEVKEAGAQEEVKMTRVWERESRGKRIHTITSNSPSSLEDKIRK